MERSLPPTENPQMNEQNEFDIKYERYLLEVPIQVVPRAGTRIGSYKEKRKSKKRNKQAKRT